MKIPFKVDLAGKTVVVTGGGGVLCGQMAGVLAECGARVAVLDLRREAAERVVGGIKRDGGRAFAVACDVLDRESLLAANAAVEKEFGPVDILINGVGGNHPKGSTGKEFLDAADLKKKRDAATFYEISREGFEFVFDLNLLSTFLATQVFTEAMAAKRKGVVINISSMTAFTPLTKVPAYSAAKAAVSNFTRWLAVHMSKVGIRVNAIAPGFFLTEQNERLLTEADGSFTARGKRVLDHTPLGRLGKPEDLAGVLLWLVSDAGAGFVTGAVIPVDGGFSAYGGV